MASTPPLHRSKSAITLCDSALAFIDTEHQQQQSNVVFFTSDEDTILFDASMEWTTPPAPCHPEKPHVKKRSLRRSNSFPGALGKRFDYVLQESPSFFSRQVGILNDQDQERTESHESLTHSDPSASVHASFSDLVTNFFAAARATSAVTTTTEERKTRSAELRLEQEETENDAMHKLNSDPSGWRAAAGRKLRSSSILSGAAIASASRLIHEKTQRVAQSQKFTLRNFQLNGGGLVKWLHGEEEEGENDDEVAALASNGPEATSSEASVAAQEPAPPVDASESDQPAPPLSPSANLPTAPPPSPHPSDGPDSPSNASFMRSQMARHRANSLLENIYGKFKRSPSDAESPTSTSSTGSGRIALQPSPRRTVMTPPSTSGPFSFGRQTDTELNIGFDDFINTEGVSAKARARIVRENRQRAASEGTSPRSVFKSFTSSPATSDSTPVFPMEECLADPKLAAEFVNTMMPDDSSILMLFYSIEEYEALVTTTELVPSFQIQVTYATTIIEKFLIRNTKLPPSLSPTIGLEMKKTIEQCHISSTNILPKTLFKDVYDAIYVELSTAYEKFKETREYALLLERKQQQEQTAMTIDEVLDDEWCAAVFWMFLYRTSHHHRLSFLMEKSFKLDPLFAVYTSNTATYGQLVTLLKLMSRKYLNKSAPVALPTTSPIHTRWKEEIRVETTYLQSQKVDDAAIQRIMEKINALYAEARIEFKKTSFERFCSFAASTLYREFIELRHHQSDPGPIASSARDIVQLLRSSRIPFHQAPVTPPTTPDLRSLISSQDHGILSVFSFIKTDAMNAQARVQPFEFVELLVSNSDDSSCSPMNDLLATVEHFLVPEASSKTFQMTDIEIQQELCFNFVAGNGDGTLYGAVWRMPLLRNDRPPTVQGLCILSKHPLVTSLRSFLQVFADRRHVAEESSMNEIKALDFLNDDVASTLEDATAQLRASVNTTVSTINADQSAMDFGFDDLFECLSITHILRLFAFVLMEKKIVLVSSSYSILLSVGETLKALMHPLVWSHIYVPVLPMAMKGYLHCPTPFIFGVHTSYVRNSDVPRPSDDLVIVNLDCDSVVGGGDVVLPPARSNILRDKLTKLCKPRLLLRDHVQYSTKVREAQAAGMPSDAIAALFHTEVADILSGLEAYAFRFEFHGKSVSVVDTSNKARQWATDSARFYSALLQTQAFSTHIGTSRKEI